MRRFALFFFCLAAGLSSAAAAQGVAASDTELLTDLQSRHLFFREGWRDDKLHFDAAGKLIGTSPRASFAVSGVHVTSVHRKGAQLQVEGRRFGLIFRQDAEPSEVDLLTGGMLGKRPENVSIVVDAPSDQPSVALEAIFVDGLGALAPLLPAEWQHYAASHFAPNAHEVYAAGSAGSKAERTWPAGLTPPKLAHAVDPKFTHEARTQLLSGESVLDMVVDAAGIPQKLSIRRATGLGLDEAALFAVSQYRFQPAMRDGKPVPVDMTVAVNFSIY